MASRRTPDSFSSLPNCLLVLIISMLPFKDSVRTSVLSKRWRNLCYERKSLVFKESDFVKACDEFDEEREFKRGLFVRATRQWIKRFTGKVVESIELHFSQPMGFHAEIKSLVEFAASLQVKNLTLDLSSHVGVLEDTIVCWFNYQMNELDITYIFFNLIYIRNLTICSFLLQMVQDCDDPKDVHDPMKTEHLVMRTNMQADDFVGIGIFLNCCPELESLTFDMITTELVVRAPSPSLDPDTYWLTNKTYECLEKKLKVVEVKNFRGGWNELQVLQYLIRTGLVMERLDLYEAKGLNDDERRLVLVGVEELQQKFKRASNDLRITLYTDA